MREARVGPMVHNRSCSIGLPGMVSLLEWGGVEGDGGQRRGCGTKCACARGGRGSAGRRTGVVVFFFEGVCRQRGVGMVAVRERPGGWGSRHHDGRAPPPPAPRTASGGGGNRGGGGGDEPADIPPRVVGAPACVSAAPRCSVSALHGAAASAHGGAPFQPLAAAGGVDSCRGLPALLCLTPPVNGAAGS